MILGIDVGGTFADFRLDDAGRVRIHRVLNPARDALPTGKQVPRPRWCTAPPWRLLEFC
jgi:N-methylhydantoinase A/oxoprolinase/acetone carboxylase beta subunit